MDDIKFDQIMKRLDAIEEKINRIDSKSAQMTQHISFVQSVYATLRSPLNYLTSYVTREPSQLPSPEDVQDLQGVTPDHRLSFSRGSLCDARQSNDTGNVSTTLLSAQTQSIPKLKLQTPKHQPNNNE